MQYDLVNFRENHIGVVLHANPSPPTSRKSVYDNNRAIFMCVEQFILSTERMHSSIYPFPGLFRYNTRPAGMKNERSRPKHTQLSMDSTMPHAALAVEQSRLAEV